eukprot:3886769-Rhodomonas_salina.4
MGDEVWVPVLHGQLHATRHSNTSWQNRNRLIPPNTMNLPSWTAKPAYWRMSGGVPLVVSRGVHVSDARSYS